MSGDENSNFVSTTNFNLIRPTVLPVNVCSYQANVFCGGTQNFRTKKNHKFGVQILPTSVKTLETYLLCNWRQHL